MNLTYNKTDYGNRVLIMFIHFTIISKDKKYQMFLNKITSGENKHMDYKVDQRIAFLYEL
jgi:hypothetical protein